jgi:hypothetical protein
LSWIWRSRYVDFFQFIFSIDFEVEDRERGKGKGRGREGRENKRMKKG